MLTDKKVTKEQLQSKGVIAAPDRLTGSAAENKAVFDRLIGDIVAVNLNPIIDELVGSGGAANIGGSVAGLSGSNVQALLVSLKGYADTKFQSEKGYIDEQIAVLKAYADEKIAQAQASASQAVQAAGQAAQVAQEALERAAQVYGLASSAQASASQALELALSVSYLYDPVTGALLPIQEVLYHVFDASRIAPITAAEYAALGLTASEYAAKQVTAQDYAMRAKQLLGG